MPSDGLVFLELDGITSQRRYKTLLLAAHARMLVLGSSIKARRWSREGNGQLRDHDVIREDGKAIPELYSKQGLRRNSQSLLISSEESSAGHSIVGPSHVVWLPTRQFGDARSARRMHGNTFDRRSAGVQRFCLASALCWPSVASKVYCRVRCKGTRVTDINN